MTVSTIGQRDCLLLEVASRHARTMHDRFAFGADAVAERKAEMNHA
jgi:hypothetical protein